METFLSRTTHRI